MNASFLNKDKSMTKIKLKSLEDSDLLHLSNYCGSNQIKKRPSNNKRTSLIDPKGISNRAKLKNKDKNVTQLEKNTTVDEVDKK